jgi:hypothetical protein
MSTPCSTRGSLRALCEIQQHFGLRTFRYAVVAWLDCYVALRIASLRGYGCSPDLPLSAASRG